MTEERTKICSKCPEGANVHPLSQFYKAKECKLGVMNECKSCFSKRGKAKALAPKIVVEEKVCSKCGAKKKASEFHKWSRSPDGLQTECKDCHGGRNTAKPRDESVQKKTCTHCNATKPAREFYDRIYAKDGIDERCKECRKSDNAAWNKNNPEKRKPIANASAKKARGIPEKRAVLDARIQAWREANPDKVQKHRET